MATFGRFDLGDFSARETIEGDYMTLTQNAIVQIWKNHPDGDQLVAIIHLGVGQTVSDVTKRKAS